MDEAAAIGLVRRKECKKAIESLISITGIEVDPTLMVMLEAFDTPFIPTEVFVKPLSEFATNGFFLSFLHRQVFQNPEQDFEKIAEAVKKAVMNILTIYRTFVWMITYQKYLECKKAGVEPPEQPVVEYPSSVTGPCGRLLYLIENDFFEQYANEIEGLCLYGLETLKKNPMVSEHEAVEALEIFYLGLKRTRELEESGEVEPSKRLKSSLDVLLKQRAVQAYQPEIEVKAEDRQQEQ